ncbi:ZYG11 [Mytilus edulis]|uniref:ZYG11 n=1 Tax=Mytilus edulis TaxID=6550 RepID=A0A8S3PNL5_MYTED|nr:ZYG11 [Mytilus edulis]
MVIRIHPRRNKKSLEIKLRNMDRMLAINRQLVIYWNHWLVLETLKYLLRTSNTEDNLSLIVDRQDSDGDTAIYEICITVLRTRDDSDIEIGSIMLDTIQNRLRENNCDEIMEMAWSTMWNVTDETAINCDRFMEHNGMSLFIECLETFPEKPELLRNMMGLMGNIAEVPYLRPKLMEKSFIEIFCELLDSEKDGIEVSYNSAGVFSHMMADGPTAWTIQSPTMAPKSTRNINYRSFTPILKIVDAYHALGAQYWAVWALCNLTTVYPQKYCPLLKKEGGEERITSILHNPKTIVKIKDLAHKIIKNLNMNPDNSNEPGDSESSDLED